jgi:hypothetical protein
MFSKTIKFSAVCKRIALVCLGVMLLVPVAALAAPPKANVTKGVNTPFRALAAVPSSDLVTITWENGYGSVIIDKWMLKSDGVTPADWLGRKYDNKTMQEVINIVYCDQYATSADNAKSRMESFFKKAGFNSQWGHSTGYKGYLSGTTFDQIPAGNGSTGNAYSDSLTFLTTNNHGRVFGPYYTGKMYVFIAAFSRENMITHSFNSFNVARDALANNLTAKAGFGASNSLSLYNQIASTDTGKTTGDHDGYAQHVWAPQ